MSDLPIHDPAERELDAALRMLRREEPAEPLRRDLVWSRIAAAPAPQRLPFSSGSRRWAAAAAVALFATGALTFGRWQERSAHVDPLLVDAAHVLRAVDSADGDSLRTRSALLLVAARAEADRAAGTPERVRLLHDVEYVLAQVVDGGLRDDVERELTRTAIRDRRLLSRLDEERAQ